MAPIQNGEPGASLLILPPLPNPPTQRSLRSAYRTTFETLLPRLARPGKKSISRLDIAVTLPASRVLKARTANYTEDQLTFQEIYTLICLTAARTQTELDFPGGVDARVFLLVVPGPDGTSTVDQTTEGESWVSGPVVDLKSLIASNRPYRTLYSVDGEEGESVLQAFLLEHRNQQKTALPINRLPSGPSMTISASKTSADATASATEAKESKVHHNVIVGGTFDHLHLGHKLLLTATVYLSDPRSDSSGNRPKQRVITIGTTGDELLVNKKHSQHLESWETRQQRSHEFIDSILNFYPASISASTSTTPRKQQQQLTISTTKIDIPGPNGKTVRVTYTISDSKSQSQHNSRDDDNDDNRKDPQGQDQGQSPNASTYETIINYTQISDPFGPTITEENISAIVISAETRQGGQAVNDKRREKHWEELEIFEVGVLDAHVDAESDGENDEQQQQQQKEKERENFDGKISSTEIRRRLVELDSNPSGPSAAQVQHNDGPAKTVGGEKL